MSSADTAPAAAAAAAATAGWTLGFDLGGTFVDLLLRAPDGREHRRKFVREAGPAATAALAALRRLLAETGVPATAVARVLHGSTVVTNLLVERQLPPAAWLTTRGFADVLALGRQQRAELYSAVPEPAQPLALFPDRAVFEIGGRIDAAGVEVQALDLADVDAAADALAASAARSAGIGLLFSHLNPAHELALAQRLTQRLPGLLLSLSHRVDAQPREAERFAATALQAALRPALADDLGALAQGMAALGLPAPSLMASDTRLLALDQALDAPLRLALSGPAAALRAAAAAGRTLVCMDVGGTTTDLGLVEAGRPRLAETLRVGGYLLRQPAADIVSLPLGGGSLVRLLPGGALRIGPASAGADPGPAAYGRGGTQATVSDALLLLGRLPPQLAGGLALQRERAEAVLLPLAQALGCTLPALAASIASSAAAVIAEGLKQQAFERGFDAPRALLLAAGGGGGQHAAEVAARVGMQSVWVPAQAGLLAASGLLDGPAAQAVGPAQAWPGVAAQGRGPAALFGRMQTAWVPAGWQWRLDERGDLWLQLADKAVPHG